MALCLSVCLSVCLPVCHKLVFYRKVWADRAILGMESSFDLSYTMLWENSGIYKNKGTSIWNSNSGLKKIHYGTSLRHVDIRVLNLARQKCTLDCRRSTKSCWQCMRRLTMSLSHWSSTACMMPLRGFICDADNDCCKETPSFRWRSMPVLFADIAPTMWNFRAKFHVHDAVSTRVCNGINSNSTGNKIYIAPVFSLGPQSLCVCVCVRACARARVCVCVWHCVLVVAVK